MSEQTPEQPQTGTPEQPDTPTMQYLDGDGKFTQAFRDSLPDDLGKHSFFEKHQDFKDAVVSAINKDKLIGKKAEEFWTSDDPELVEKRREIMGVPKDVADYQVKLRDDIPEDMAKTVESRIDEFKKFAFEKGIPKETVEAMVEWDMERGLTEYEGAKEQYQVSIQEAEDQLRKEWRGDKYDYNTSKVSDALEYLGLGHLKEDPAYGNNVDFIKAVFDKIVPLIADDELVEQRQTGSYAAFEDQLRDLDAKMYAYEGSTQSAAYRNMMSQREELLKKFARSA
jgi:hypothetical protein